MSASCGDKQGTTAGHAVHRRIKEQACDPCRDAYNAFSRKRMAEARKKKSEAKQASNFVPYLYCDKCEKRHTKCPKEQA